MKKQLVNYILNEFNKCEGIDLAGDSMAVTRIDEMVVSSLEKLLAGENVTIDLLFIYADEKGAKHLKVELSREIIDKL